MLEFLGYLKELGSEINKISFSTFVMDCVNVTFQCYNEQTSSDAAVKKEHY